jgi:hypothetical protein
MTQQAAPTEPDRSDGAVLSGGRRINEDWAATAVGLALVALVLLGVIAKGLVP